MIGAVSLIVSTVVLAGSHGQFLQHRRSHFRTPAPTYLVKQDFEGTGYDNAETWTESGTGTLDEDYTTSPAPLVGSQSLRVNLSSQTGNTRKTFTATATVYGYLKLHRVSNSSTFAVAQLRSSSNARLQLTVTSTGGIRITHGTSSATTTDTLSTGTTADIWYKYVQGTGTDGAAEVAWSTDGSKPTSGNKFASLSNGTATTTVNEVYLGANGSSTFEMIYDKVRVDDAVIGTNPL